MSTMSAMSMDITKFLTHAQQQVVFNILQVKQQDIVKQTAIQKAEAEQAPRHLDELQSQHMEVAGKMLRHSQR